MHTLDQENHALAEFVSRQISCISWSYQWLLSIYAAQL